MIPEKDYEKIAAYLRGQLRADERKAIEKKAEGDSAFKALVDVMKSWVEDIDDGQYRQVDSSVHALISRQLKELKKASPNSSWLKGITTFDSKLLPVPEGVRPATVDVRRVKVQFGESQLDVSLYPVSTTSYELIGQVLNWTDATPLQITLKGRGPTITADANQFQLFQFPRVPSDKYELKIKQGRRIIAVVDLEI